MADFADSDVVIAGAGLAGCSLACALSGHGLRIVLVETAAVNPAAQATGPDRAIALVLGSQRIFATLGLWDAIAPHAGPIRRIHVSDRGHFGATRLDARDMNVEALGYVVPARALGAALQRAALGLPDVELLSPATLKNTTQDDGHAKMTIASQDGERELRAQLLIGADGASSTVRNLTGIEMAGETYSSVALVGRVTAERAHDGCAFERFTPHGPLALLPLRDGGMGLVWTMPATDAERQADLDPAAFVADLQRAFGNRLGRFLAVMDRRIYPLARQQAGDIIGPRMALIGNAAHVVHPVAGQGFNLGLRDVAVLAEKIVRAARAGQDFGTKAVLDDYARQRRRDHLLVRGFTHGLISVFANDLPLVGPARGLGLAAVDLIPPIKRALLRRTMGLAGRQSRLARGLSI